MNREKKKKNARGVSTRELMGIENITDCGLATRLGRLVFFIIKPTNISVLPEASVTARIFALLNVIKGQSDIEMLAMNSKESFEDNKNYYRRRMDEEELPVLRKLLEQDCNHLDRIQILMATAREFFLVVRLHDERESEILPYLARIESSIRDSGFTVRRADEQDIMRMFAVYYEQNVTTEHHDRYDGERWAVLADGKEETV